jgi:hypothetical protein
MLSQPVYAGTIGTTTATPSSLPAGVATTVTFTAQINGPSVIASSVNLQQVNSSGQSTVVGTMYDDGSHGDATAGDGVYTLQFSIFQQTTGALIFRVSAAFQGSLTRALSAPINVNVTGVGTAINITSPAQSAYLNISPTIVTGTVSDPQATVTVNGLPAQVSGTSFSASIPLREGSNVLTAVAQNSNGLAGTASETITLDTAPPHVTVNAPADGAMTSESSIDVSGIVNDIVVGTVNPLQATVSVNGVSAQVDNRSYLAGSVPLQLGANTITATARDRAGNFATTSVTVTRMASTGQPTLRIVSGNGLGGSIRSLLAAPLVVQALNAAGQPIANTPIVFRVVDGDGMVTAGSPPGMASIAVNTNGQGQAQVNYVLGSRAGAGNNQVQASATGIATTPIFTESATTAAPAMVVVDSGNNQNGVVGQSLPLPFIAIVTDSGHNRLANVQVSFTVTQGGGTIGGKNAAIATSDSDGRVQAVLTLGPQSGINSNVVAATFSGNTGLPATFSATSLIPGPPQNTAISGVVLDNSNVAIPGVTMRLYQVNNGGTGVPQEVAPPVTTDTHGYFAIQPAPVGVYKLMADGTTATRVGPFPTLEYDMVTVSGQNNTVGLPIYLPQLLPGNQLCVSPTVGGTLTIPQAPGFALNIAAGSVTFPGGSQTGCVSVTPVNMDKVPMVPGFGQQPRFIVTIQPVGATFNPPAQITIPNVDGLAPRAVTEMYSYDHDLASFVAIGTGTVSADGSVIASDPGVGVLKAGWHCGGDPNANGTVADCPTCQKCINNQCATDPAQDQKSCSTPAVPSGICVSGACTPIHATLQEVTFSGPLHTVAKDSDGSNYATPQWTTGGNQFPVSYTRSTTATVAAKFQLDHAAMVSSAMVKGDGPGGLHVEGPATVSGTTLTFPPTAFGGALPATIKKFDPFQITWQVSFDGGSHYSAGGSSTNKMYVTLADPGGLASPLYETTLDIGARNASGQSAAAGTVTSIWANFAGRSVARADGVVMGYWTGGAATCQSLALMLASAGGDGSCVAWAQLWHQTLEAEGITGSHVYQITADTTVSPGATGFLVKNWTFGQHIRTGPDGLANSTRKGDDVSVPPPGPGANPDVPEIAPGANGTLDSTLGGDDTSQDGYFPGTAYPYVLFSWTDVFGMSGNAYGDAAEQPGIPGQRNANPPPLFYNHFVVEYGGQVWDPSYGAGPFASELAHKNAAIDGLAASGRAVKNSAAQLLDYAAAPSLD